MFPGQPIVVVVRNLRLRYLRALLFILLNRFFPWLEWCEIWFIINQILRAIFNAGIVVVPPAQHPWDIDDEDADPPSQDTKEIETEEKDTKEDSVESSTILCNVVRKIEEMDRT